MFHYCNVFGPRAMMPVIPAPACQCTSVHRRDARSVRLAHDHLTYDDLLRIVELIKTSEQFSEFRLKVGDIEVELRRHGAGTSPVTSLTPQSTLLPAAPADAMQPAPETNSLSARREVGAPSPAMTALPEDAIVIRAPMVGTFYRAPEPGAQPFVEVGQSVEPDAI